MTETTVRSQKLPPAVEQFVLRWGDMGGQWGVNRSVAQIQALLFLSDRPLTAEDIAETLIRRVPVLGDRRDHYEAEADLWQIMTHIARGRKEREIDPAVAALRHVLETACLEGRRTLAALRAAG